MARSQQKPKVRMHHPKANRTYDAPPTAVPFWEKHGWVVGEPSATKTTTAKAAEKKEA